MRASIAVLICAAALSTGAISAEKAEKTEKAPKSAAKKAAPATPEAPAAAATPAAAAAAATPAAAGTTTADPPKKEEPASPIASTPLEPVPTELVNEPPGAIDPAVTPVAAAAPLPSRWRSVDAVLEDLRLADVVLLLFALMVALFALRTSSGTSRLRTLARRQAEDNHRAIEASTKAADAAQRSAAAAEQTLASLRETSERQLRAYVTVKQFLQAPVKDERQNVHGWLLQVAWQNTGATPTKGFRYWAMLREFERAIPDAFEFTPEGLKDFAGGELGSNGTVNSPPLFISLQQIARIQDGSRKILLLGQADYHDMVRDTKRETRFCVELVVVNDPSGTNGSPFSFSYHPQYNSIT